MTIILITSSFKEDFLKPWWSSIHYSSIIINYRNICKTYREKLYFPENSPSKNTIMPYVNVLKITDEQNEWVKIPYSQYINFIIIHIYQRPLLSVSYLPLFEHFSWKNQCSLTIIGKITLILNWNPSNSST